MKNRQKEFNETVNATLTIQNQMDDCETLEELQHTLESWQQLIKNIYLKRVDDIVNNKI